MKKFLYFLLEDDGRSLTVVNDVVTASNLPVPLENTPDGWQDITIGWERDLRTVGMVRNFSLPLGFVRSGAKILRKVVYDGSIERKISLFIARRYTDVDLTAQTFKHTYRKYYKGELDLSTFLDQTSKVTASLMEGGIQKLFNANKGTAYEFLLSDGDARIKMDGVVLHNNVLYTLPDQVELSNEFYTFLTLPFSFINKEGTAPGLAFFTQSIEEITNESTYITTSDNYAVISNHTEAVTLQFKGSYTYVVTQNDIGGIFRTRFRTSLGQNIQQDLIPGTLNTVGSTHTISYDLAITLQPGEKLFFLGTLIGNITGSIGLKVEFLPKSDTIITYQSRFKSTTVDGLTLYRLGQLLTKAITGSEANFSSALLKERDDLVVTSGDGLRGLAGAKIKTSFNEFWECVHTELAAGQGIEGGKIVIEPKTHFLDNTNPISLGKAKDLQVSIPTDLLFNTIKTGYNEFSTDDVNGKFAFNNTHVYKTVVTRVTKELTLVSPYMADPYAIEITRINMEGKTTTDNTADNQVFIIDTAKVKGTYHVTFSRLAGISFISISGLTDTDLVTIGTTITITGSRFNNKTFDILGATAGVSTVLLLVRQRTTNEVADVLVSLSTRILNRPVATITGVPDPLTIFNWRLSPKRILLTHMPWINSVLYDLVGTKITFQTTEKNADLKTVEGSVTIEEKADVTVGTDNIFLCKEASFDVPVPSNLAEIMQADVNRSFSFEWNGVTYTGFSHRVGIAPSDEKEQSVKLLFTANNNLSNFIR